MIYGRQKVGYSLDAATLSLFRQSVEQQGLGYSDVIERLMEQWVLAGSPRRFNVRETTIPPLTERIPTRERTDARLQSDPA